MELSAIISKFCKEKHVCIKMFKYLSIYIRILKHYKHHLGIFIFVPLISLWYLYLLFCIKGPHSIIISSLLQLIIILYYCGELEGDLEREGSSRVVFSRILPPFHFLLWHTYLQVLMTVTGPITEVSDSTL